MSVSIYNNRTRYVCETITKTFFTNCWPLFSGFNNFHYFFFGQLKDWVGQVLFLVSCPKGQVKKNVNVEACRATAKWTVRLGTFYTSFTDQKISHYYIVGEVCLNKNGTGYCGILSKTKFDHKFPTFSATISNSYRIFNTEDGICF